MVLLRGPVSSQVHDRARRDIEQLLVECEDLYPGIDLWLRSVALPGIDEGSRLGVVAYLNDVVAGGALVKLHNEPKLCSLRVLPDYEGQGIGTSLFAAAATDLVRAGRSMFFTAPESLVESRQVFFERLGFARTSSLGKVYRPSENEWVYRGDPRTVLAKATRRMGKRNGGTLLMSVRPEYAHAIASGEKLVELRRRFSGRHVGSTVLIYASSPEQSLVAVAEIGEVETFTPGSLDPRMLERAACDLPSFRSYASGAERLHAIGLVNVRPIDPPVERRWLEKEIGARLFAPQSYQVIRPFTAWAEAISRVVGMIC